MIPPDTPAVVSFDFYQTLAFHRDGVGRGVSVMAYLQAQRLSARPWEHQVLYDIFAPHLTEYDPAGPEEQKAAYRVRLANRLFERLSVSGARASAHSEALWELLGPSSLELYPETLEVLDRIRATGIRVVITSNWQAGLRHFCDELGILPLVSEVFVSAEIGFQKPDARIFEKIVAELEVPPSRIVHVGDSVVDDFEGARNAGIPVVVIDREGAVEDPTIPAIQSLAGVLPILGIE